MTDSTPSPDERPKPRYGEYAPPGYVPPNFSGTERTEPAAEPTKASPSPAEPPRAETPGLIPVRPLTVTEMLSAGFGLLRRSPKATLVPSLIINGIIALASIALIGSASFREIEAIITSAYAQLDGPMVAGMAVTFATVAVEFTLGLVGLAILQGIVSLEVARASLGERMPLAALWRAVLGRVPVLIGWSLLTGLALALPLLLIGGVSVLLGALGPVGAGIAALAALAGVTTVGVLAVWAGTKLCLVPSILVIEGAPLLTAVRRSWRLTNGRFWRVLGIQLLVALIVGTITQIALFPLGNTLAEAALDPANDAFFASFATSTIVSALVGAVTAVVSAAVTTLIYIDTRMRTEGLDRAITRFIAAPSESTDPFEAPRD